MPAKKAPKSLASAKKSTPPPDKTTISNCNFEASWHPANEHARAAVEALARAAQANAEAIQEAARILNGGNLGSMITVGTAAQIR